MVSEKPAQEVVASHTTAQPETEPVSSSINRHLTLPTFQHNMVGVSTHCIYFNCCLQGTAVFDVIPSAEERENYTYQPPSQDLLGPGVPDLDELGGYG